MVVQHNAISPEAQPLAAHYAGIRFHRALLALLVIAGVTILLGLYVYQASVRYQLQLDIRRTEQEYAREQRLLTMKLQQYAEAQSMEEIVQRARAAGYRPPTTAQIRYVKIDNGTLVSQDGATPLVAAKR